MRIMTFNVRGDYDDGVNAWAGRSALNVATILAHAPDVVGFQEAQGAHLEVYREGLAGYSVEPGPAYNNEEPYSYNVIAWRDETLEKVEAGGFWLSETPDELGFGWDAACVRSANWVRFRGAGTVADAPTGVFCNTHLDHRGETARLEGARLVAARLAELRRPGETVVVAGDFNCAPGSAPVGAFAEAGYVDLFETAGGAAPGDPASWTFHAFTGEPSAAHRRIDWIMMLAGAPAMRASRAVVIRDAEPPVYPSDHFPVVVDLEV